jgi:single-strand DNA-binding protein
MNILVATVRLGADAELRFTPEGTAVCSFNAAMQSGYGKSEKTNWLRCSVFGKRGETLAPMLLKGTQVAVAGELSMNEYTNKQGENKSSLDLRVNDVTLLGKKELSAPQEQAKSNGYQPQPEDPMDNFEDDVPF